MNHTHGDRLSGLPDNLIHKILSFVDTAQAIETSALSSRWRYTWTSMPSLNLSNKDFGTCCNFSEFVIDLLYHRNNQIELSDVKLSFHGNDSQALVKRVAKRILNYRPSHLLQKLDITCVSTTPFEAPLVFLSSQCLTHLTLTRFIYTPAAYELLALTTLILQDVTLCEENTDKCGGLFSNCANLKNLTLNHCRMDSYKPLNISHPRLLNLTLEKSDESATVVTPQLKSLIVRHSRMDIVLSAPNLVSLQYTIKYWWPLQLSGKLLHLEKADICMERKESFNDSIGRKVLCMIQQLTSVKVLNINTRIMEILSSYMKLISHQPSPFTNLKRLNIYPHYVNPEEPRQPPKITLSAEVMQYFLDGSPDSTHTFVSHEEIRDLRNVASAQNLMRELQVLLDEWKMDSERMTRINEQFKKGHKGNDLAISKMDKIERLLRKLPTSHLTKLQASFSILCAEAETIMNNMMNHMKI